MTVGQAETLAASQVTLLDTSRGDQQDMGTSRRLIDYELIQELGRGGMGVVYKARQISLNRPVALKMILAGHFAGETEIKRFRIEAEAAAALEHPNIVPIYEIGNCGREHYFSMKLVSGQSLAQQIHRFKCDHRAAAIALVKIARAVHYAHQRGILHRDLKPANILVDSDGEPHISDFGLARRINEDVDLTVSGAVLGTPSYMAPEQAAGNAKSLTTAADIWSLGAIFYHLLLGRPPFKGATSVEILRQVIEEDPPKPRFLLPALDRDLETICLKCLEKNPLQRYGSAEALADDLDRWLRREPIQARPVTTREQLLKWIQRKPVIAGLATGLFIVGIAGLAGVLSQWNRAEVKATESQQRLTRIHVINALRFADEADFARPLPWYTEALRLANDPASQANLRLRIGWLLQQLPHVKRVWLHDHQVWFVQLSPKEDRLLTISGPEPVRNRFKDAELRVWDYRTGQAISPPIPFSGGRPPIYRIRYEAFSPDGQNIVTIQTRDVTDNKTVSLVMLCDPLSGQPVSPPMEHEGTVSQVAFSSDGSHLVTASNAGSARIWDLSRNGQPGPFLTHDGPITSASFSPDGKLLVTGSLDRNAKLWDVATGQLLAPALLHKHFVLDAQFSPNGKFLVTAASDTAGGEFRVWDSATGRPISDNVQAQIENVIYQATFSADSRQILTASYDGNAVLWDTATARMISAPLRHNHGVLMAVFSPDRAQVATASFDRTARLWNLDRSGLWNIDNASSGFAVLNHCSFVLQALFSKHNQRIITASSDRMVRDWELPGSRPGMITLTHSNSVLHAEFSPDATRVVTASSDQTARIWDARTGLPVTAPLVHSGAVYHATFNSNSTIVATASADGTARLWNAATGAQISPSLQHSNIVWHVAFNNRGNQIVTASGHFRTLAASSSYALRNSWWRPGNPRHDINGEARIWDVASGQPVTPPLLHSDAVVHAAFSPNDQTIVTSSADRTAQLWSAIDGRKIGSVMSHAGQVFKGYFHPNGEILATVAGGGGTLSMNAVHFWNAFTGQPTNQVLEHGDIVHTAKFSRNGLRLITGSEDGNGRIWDVKTGTLSVPPLANGSSVNIVLQADLSPDGQLALTATVNGTVRIWDARSGDEVAQLRLHSRQINASTFSPNGQLVLSASDDGTAKITPLPQTNWSVEDVRLFSHVLSTRKINAAGNEVLIDENEFRDAWQALCQRFPDLFSAHSAPRRTDP